MDHKQLIIAKPIKVSKTKAVSLRMAETAKNRNTLSFSHYLHNFCMTPLSTCFALTLVLS